MSFIFFYVLKKVNRLRLDGLFEVIGIDCMMHGTQNEVFLDFIRRQNYTRNVNVNLASKLKAVRKDMS